MADEAADGAIVPGSYNDARIALKGDDIRVGQNPAMFIVLAVIALIIGGVLFFLAGSGRMEINDIPIPPEAAKVIGMVIGAAFFLATGVCVLQSMSPAALVLSPARGVYKKTGGIVAKLLRRPDREGSLQEFDKLKLAHESGQAAGGKPYECWRLTLYWKEGANFNLGSFGKAEQARQIARGFSARLKLPLEEC